MKRNPSAATTKARMIKRGAWAERNRKVKAGQKAEAEAKRVRRDRLKRASTVCAADRAKTTRKCASRRSRIRTKARADIEAAKQARRAARALYSQQFGTGAVRKARPKRYSKAESDSLAMHSIPAELHELWTEDRARYSYDLPPDQRALAFLEWADKHPKDVEERLVRFYEDTYSDDYWAEQERLAYEARA